MKRIILDTDFLLHNLNKGVNFLVEIDRICDFKYEICVLDKTLDEIKGKKGEKLALEFISKKLKIIKTLRNKSVDELLLNIDDIIVVTHDRELKERLKNRGIPVIDQRSGKNLILHVC
jgi:rRNA-processing protein FCF1